MPESKLYGSGTTILAMAIWRETFRARFGHGGILYMRGSVSYSTGFISLSQPL